MLYELPLLDHFSPKSVQEAVQCLSSYGSEAKVLGGGTDLLGLMKDGITGPKMPIPKMLVDIKRIPGLDRIEYSEGKGLTIGAAATIANIERSKVVLERFPILSQAANSVATKQIRNMGTLGGNLCQRPWCWYFRSPNFNCFKKGGKQCYATTGNNKYYFSVLGLGICVMAHPSDMAPALIALGSSVRIEGPSGSRTIPLEDFFNGPKETFETVLKENELISGVSVPEQQDGSRGVYLKQRLRGTWDFALASVAAVVRVREEVCEDARVILGGVAPFPWQAAKCEEALRGKKIGHEIVSKASHLATEGASPLSMNRYKVTMIESLVKRALVKSFNS